MCEGAAFIKIMHALALLLALAVAAARARAEFLRVVVSLMYLGLAPSRAPLFSRGWVPPMLGESAFIFVVDLEMLIYDTPRVLECGICRAPVE
jgi:hypothetical protein